MNRSMILFAVALMAGCSPQGGTFDQARKLGSDKFTSQGWAFADQEARGRMVASMLRTVDPESLSARQIRDLLGANTAHYEHDEFPAYRVGPTSIQSQHGRGYLLVFVTDHDSGRVKEVRIVPAIA